jgi:hypothetical protein
MPGVASSTDRPSGSRKYTLCPPRAHLTRLSIGTASAESLASHADNSSASIAKAKCEGPLPSCQARGLRTSEETVTNGRAETAAIPCCLRHPMRPAALFRASEPNRGAVCRSRRCGQGHRSKPRSRGRAELAVCSCSMPPSYLSWSDVRRNAPEDRQSSPLVRRMEFDRHRSLVSGHPADDHEHRDPPSHSAFQISGLQAQPVTTMKFGRFPHQWVTAYKTTFTPIA